jgi:hypothetical protein
MAVIGELLFYNSNGLDLDSVLRYRASQGLSQAADAIPEADFAKHKDEELATRVAEQASMQPLTVDFDKAEPQVAPATVTVRDFGRMITVKGYRVTKTIPFSGDSQLWALRTNPANFSPPHGEVRHGHLVIGIELPEGQAERAADELDRTVASIREYLGWQAAQIQQHNAALHGQALPLVQQRRAYLNKGAALLDGLKKR